jgi:hypothetical protein
MKMILPFFLGGEAHGKRVPSSLKHLETIFYPAPSKTPNEPFMRVAYHLQTFVSDYGVLSYAYVHHGIQKQEAFALYHEALFKPL